MEDLADFKRGQIISVPLAGASVTKTATLLGVLTATVSRVMSAYMNNGKTESAKGNSGQKSTLTESDCRKLRRAVSKNYTTTAVQVRVEMNIHLEDPVSTKTVQHELHKSNIHGRAAITKSLITESNGQTCKRWCHVNIKPGHQITGNASVIWSNESFFMLFPTAGRVYIWRTPKEAYNLECLVPTVKHGGGSVMIWAAISRKRYRQELLNTW
jgi:transposase